MQVEIVGLTVPSTGRVKAARRRRALGEIESQEDSFPIAVNCLDDDPVVYNRFHEFVINKPTWCDISEAVEKPRFR